MIFYVAHIIRFCGFTGKETVNPLLVWGCWCFSAQRRQRQSEVCKRACETTIVCGISAHNLLHGQKRVQFYQCSVAVQCLVCHFLSRMCCNAWSRMLSSKDFSTVHLLQCDLEHVYVFFLFCFHTGGV